ncbi:MAG TPA: septum site-determining protein MinC, partial [Oligoflexia bacterium]|nr:septum site-determining protein MinC [Oligoflexia bacterium]
LEKLPTKEQSKELEDILRTHYGIEVVVRRRKCANIRLAKDDKVCSQKKGGGGSTIPLFEESGAGTAAAPGGAEHREADHGTSSFSGVGTSHAYEAPFFALDGAEAGMQHGSAKFGAASVKGGGAPGYISPTSRKYLSQVSKLLGDDALYEEDANAKVVFGTLRSGQRIETPFSLVVIGDINPGADLIAGEDIIVLGNLRGTAHASAYDDDSFEHVIIALRMQPMQLRIGSVISRGSDEEVLGAEIARIENRRIIVEPFSPRDFLMRRGR